MYVWDIHPANDLMNLTVVIPYWNGQASIGQLLSSLPPGLPVIVVDDHSDVPLQLHTLPREVQLIRPKDKGYFTGAVNVGMEACQTDVLILNQDSWLEGDKWAGLIATNQDRYALIGERIKGDHPAWPDGYVHGTFMYLRRDAIKTTGLLDAKHYPLWGSTADYQCRLARKGYESLAVADVPGFHHERNARPYGSAIAEMLNRKPELKGQLVRTPPTVSVIVTCYNYGQYLGDAIASLIGGTTFLGDTPGQSFQGFEVIIVDDGSTDDTAEVAQSLVSNAKGIHYIRQENKGSASAMNTGIRAAHGRYIAPLDADDMMKSRRLELMLDMAERNPHGVVYDDVTIFNQEKVRTTWKMTSRYDFNTLLERNTMHKGLLYPRQAWRDVGGYAETMDKGREDWAFNIALGLKGWCGVYLNYEGYLYRRAGQNRTLYNTTPQWRSHFMNQIVGLFPGVFQGERPMGCCGAGASNGNNNNGFMGGGNGQQASYMAGADGMVLVEYKGGNAGDSSWWGVVTSTRYYLGGATKQAYVDEKDVPGFLNLWEGGRALFAVVPQPASVVDPEPEAQTEEVKTLVTENALPADDTKQKALSVKGSKKKANG